MFPDRICEQYSQKLKIPQVERCELVRHCRWVDEVVEDAPWRIDEAFLSAHRVDYVAIDEGASIDPAYDKERVKGYDLVKGLREFLVSVSLCCVSEGQKANISPPGPLVD